MDIQPEIYQHFKGMKYRVIGVAKHSETMKKFVVYEALYENPQGKLWIRPLEMFIETIERDGKKQPRFRYLDQNE